MKQILLVGCGGIGSFLCRELYNLVINNVQGLEAVNITIVDGDMAEEKNLKYQCFDINDLGKNKALALQEKYLFNVKTDFIKTEDDLKGYDVIISAVDNSTFRDLLYKYADKNSNVYYIDLRSEGRTISYFTKHIENTLEYLSSTLDLNRPPTSCQLKYELDNGIIQLGNRIVAMMGAQLLLNFLRGDSNPARFIQRV